MQLGCSVCGIGSFLRVPAVHTLHLAIGCTQVDL